LVGSGVGDGLGTGLGVGSGLGVGGVCAIDERGLMVMKKGMTATTMTPAIAPNFVLRLRMNHL
jgi:hypothetical protein